VPPKWLRWYYVPGFAYHGHHIYCDDSWLMPDHHDDRMVALADLCGARLDAFRYDQEFCAYFAKLYPDGVQLAALMDNAPSEVSHRAAEAFGFFE